MPDGIDQGFIDDQREGATQHCGTKQFSLAYQRNREPAAKSDDEATARIPLQLGANGDELRTIHPRNGGVIAGRVALGRRQIRG